MKENYITKKILEDAKTFADDLVKDAKKKSAEKLQAVKKQLAEEETAALDDAKIKAEHAAVHQNALQEIAVRKAKLAQKQAALDDAFNLAKIELLKNTKTDFISELVNTYAQKGDVVTVSKKLPDTLVSKFKLKEVIDKSVEGIILSNANYELNLTFDELLKTFRARHESEIAKILFPEG